MSSYALFPISVANRQFSTDNVQKVLSKLPNRITHLTFLIADWLQLYNKVKNCSDTESLGKVIRDYNERNRELENRHRWLEKILESSTNLLMASHEIVGMEHYFDGLYANTFRNINILHSIDEKFSRDINKAALLFLSKGNMRSNKIAIKLSEQYILEEIALNIRIRVKENLDEEYYLGLYHVPMLRIYANCYSASVQDLLGKAIPHKTDFKFYSIKDLDNCSWEQVII